MFDRIQRLTPLDRLFVAVVVPVWLGLLALHTVQWVAKGIWEPGIYVSAPAEAAGFPEVRDRREHTGGALAVGDALVRVGPHSLEGANALAWFALAMDALDDSGRAPVVFERDGVRLAGELEFVRMPLPVRFVAVATSFTTMALLLLLRAPRSRSARALARGAMLFSFGFLRPWGAAGPELTYVLFGIVLVVGCLALPAVAYALAVFPDDSAPLSRSDKWLPWAFVPVGPIYLNSIVGVSLLGEESNVSEALSLLLLFTFGLTLIVLLIRNYLRCDPIGRRRIKWVVWGVAIVLVPVEIATATSLIVPELWWVSDASEILEVIIPAAIFVSIVRFNLWDIDRLITATASYSVVLGAAVASASFFVPRLAEAAGTAGGLEPRATQVLTSVVLLALVVPAHRLLSPRLDRWFFPERETLQLGFVGLLDELSQAEEPAQLAITAAERVDEMLRPEVTVIYIRGPDGYDCAFARGRAVPPSISTDHPVVGALGDRTAPLASTAWASSDSGVPLSPIERAVLETLDVAVLIPVRRRGDLLAFLCLGPKRSGDVYTQTDLTLLSGVGTTVGAELLRFDAGEIAREGRAMLESMQRYVPGAIAEEIAGGRTLEPDECEVTVLFTDVRGYTAFSEDRAAREIFSAVNRYTETVSLMVNQHGGSVVEFNGDGMMAVFGAPRALAAKELAAVLAGRDIVDALARLSVSDEERDLRFRAGVGIASGSAFVGNIRSADRYIWSAIGNTTNLAARLQALTRDLDADLVIDRDTWQKLGAEAEGFVARPRVRIAGRSAPIDVWLSGRRGNA